jgi:hypothetical protein
MKNIHALQPQIALQNRASHLGLRMLSVSLLPLLAFCVQAEETNYERDTSTQTAEVASYAVGASLGTTGLGVNLSGKTDWSLIQGDQLQWRLMAAGLNADLDDEELDFSDIEYNKGDLDLFSLQAGVDWFPFQSGWSEKIFFSTGLLYSDLDISGSADTNKTFYVGGQQVVKGDITSLQTDIENSGVMPYLSLGWGNKITGETGFDFQAEIGLAMSTSDPDVSVTAVDPANVISANDLAREKKEIEDEFDGAFGFATIAVTYHY